MVSFVYAKSLRCGRGSELQQPLFVKALEGFADGVDELVLAGERGAAGRAGVEVA